MKRKENVENLNRSSRYVSFIFILLIISVSFNMVTRSAGGNPYTTKLYVDPPKIEYWIPACGETFKVNINVADVSNLQGFEFKLYWNTTLLDLIDLEFKSFLNPLFFVFRNEINEALGRYWLNMTTIDGPPTSGSGALVTLSFKITYEPVWPENATCALNLADTKLVDSGGTPILHDVYDGEYWCFNTAFLSLNTKTDNPFYDVNESIYVYGDLTLGSSPVEDGLVALEIDDPNNEVIVIRTLSTGVPPAGQIVEIIDVIPCGGSPDYNPRSWFYKGTWAYFNISIRNNGVESRKVTVAGNVYDVNLTSLGFIAFEKTVAGDSTAWGIADFYIYGTVPAGNAVIYANALTGWPRNRGTAYCPEENATFEIRESGGGAATGSLPLSSSGSEGTYNLTFRLSPDARAGAYQVCASSSYQELSATSRTAFGVSAILVPDHYATIQAAIDAATPTNNSILVMPGTYNAHVTVNKALTLIARDQRAGRTVLEGSGTGTVVTVTANDVVVCGFTIQNSGSSVPDSGIALIGSSGSTISENTVLMNLYGINVDSSNNNLILENRLLSNNYGISIDQSTGNTLRYNTLGCNNHNFGVSGDSISDYTHSIYTSNTVNGKPVIYWTNRDNSQVPSDAGYVAIVNSRNITLRAFDLTKNVQGVLFAYTNNSVIERVNTIGNEYGIYLDHSNNNLIIGCEVSSNSVGVYQKNSNGNTIFHNNFIDNGDQLEHYQSSNTWDDGAGKGNYWSDYTGVDDGSGGRPAGDGVGDTLIPHQDVDWYPLITPWILVHDVAVINVTYTVTPYNGSIAYPITGWKVIVTVSVKNEGDFNETFEVRAYANATIIQTKVVTLQVRSSTAIKLTWNLHEYIATGNYIIRGYAWPVPYETDEADNIYIDGTIEVVEPGNPDINGDGIVDIVDIVIVALAFGSEPGDPNWNPIADLNGDGIVDIVDIVLVAIHFGETYP